MNRIYLFICGMLNICNEYKDEIINNIIILMHVARFNAAIKTLWPGRENTRLFCIQATSAHTRV